MRSAALAVKSATSGKVASPSSAIVIPAPRRSTSTTHVTARIKGGRISGTIPSTRRRRAPGTAQRAVSHPNGTPSASAMPAAENPSRQVRPSRPRVRSFRSSPITSGRAPRRTSMLPNGASPATRSTARAESRSGRLISARLTG